MIIKALCDRQLPNTKDSVYPALHTAWGSAGYYRAETLTFRPVSGSINLGLRVFGLRLHLGPLLTNNPEI